MLLALAKEALHNFYSLTRILTNLFLILRIASNFSELNT